MPEDLKPCPLNLAIQDTRREIAGAMANFPGNEHRLAALMEEVGELAQALLQHEDGEKSELDIYTEAIQVAAMALRVALEGDAGFSYEWNELWPKLFTQNSIKKDLNTRKGEE